MTPGLPVRSQKKDEGEVKSPGRSSISGRSPGADKSPSGFGTEAPLPKSRISSWLSLLGRVSKGKPKQGPYSASAIDPSPARSDYSGIDPVRSNEKDSGQFEASTRINGPTGFGYGEDLIHLTASTSHAPDPPPPRKWSVEIPCRSVQTTLRRSAEPAQTDARIWPKPAPDVPQTTTAGTAEEEDDVPRRSVKDMAKDFEKPNFKPR